MALAAFDLTGKVTLVTGGNKGIGFGLAQGLAEAGSDVVIWGTKPADNEAAAAKLKTHGNRVLALQCNVADEDAVDRAMAESVEAMGRIDGCFANAGVGGDKPQPIHQMSTAEWRRVTSVNLDGLFFTLRAASRHMIARGGGGVLVPVASTAAIMGAARASHYGATKGAVDSMTRALAVELARYRIRVNSILPGWIESDMTAAAFADERFRTAVLPRIPARRWGTGEDFSAIAVYLMSDASAYHSGDSVVIDGAYTIF